MAGRRKNAILIILWSLVNCVAKNSMITKASFARGAGPAILKFVDTEPRPRRYNTWVANASIAGGLVIRPLFSSIILNLGTRILR